MTRITNNGKSKINESRIRSKGLRICSYEILEPGTLRRNNLNNSIKFDERWCEIVEICSEVIAENDCEDLPN